MTERDETLGETIKRLRTSAKLRQIDLGERVGVGARAVMRWENDQGLPAEEREPMLNSEIGLDPELVQEARRRRHEVGNQERAIIGFAQTVFAVLLGEGEERHAIVQMVDLMGDELTPEAIEKLKEIAMTVEPSAKAGHLASKRAADRSELLDLRARVEELEQAERRRAQGE